MTALILSDMSTDFIISRQPFSITGFDSRSGGGCRAEMELYISF